MNDEHLQKDDGSDNSNRQVMIFSMLGVIVVGVCALFFLAYQWFQSREASLIDEYFPSPTATRVPTSTPAPTRTPVPNLTATQQAWVKPVESPSLASAEEARSAYDSGGVYLESFAWSFPDIPDITQAGDVYVYEISLSESTPLIWTYGWCTTTAEILEENFTHIQLEFTLNGEEVSPGNFAVLESQRDDGSPCREYVALVESWTSGQHQLESRVTFTQAIDDGWDLYPAGTHVYKYNVTFEP